MSTGRHDAASMRSPSGTDAAEIASLRARLRRLEQENLRLVEDERARQQETRALASIGRLLSERLEPQVVGQRIAESLRSLLDGRSAVVYRIDTDTANLLALAVSLEKLADATDNPRAAVLARTLDEATGKLLENGKSPSRRVGELDNRGSHFYLALYWAQALAADAELGEAFAPLAERLAAEEEKIVAELSEVQGASVDLAGYYFVDREKADAVMRPSETFNAALETLRAKA